MGAGAGGAAPALASSAPLKAGTCLECCASEAPGSCPDPRSSQPIVGSGNFFGFDAGKASASLGTCCSSAGAVHSLCLCDVHSCASASGGRLGRLASSGRRYCVLVADCTVAARAAATAAASAPLHTEGTCSKDLETCKLLQLWHTCVGEKRVAA